MERIPFLGEALDRLRLDTSTVRPGPLQPAVARTIVGRLNRDREPGQRQPLPGELLALSLLHEAAHLAIVEASRRRPEAAIGAALPAVRDAVGAREEQGLHVRFGGPGGGPAGGEAPSFVGAEVEAERFSEDREWMPRLVLLARSTYVWLDQLSKRYDRDIRTLDAVPDEELASIARRGITGLWLIGLWERSAASERIKRWRGNTEAVASAYSLDDYRIADDLGGEEALAELRARAWRHGIRMASDMVPNH